jgi:hypothetical protein
MIAGGVNERVKLIQGSFHESKIPALPSEWRQKLFDQPAPERWTPRLGERVVVRPGMTIGGQTFTHAEVFRLLPGETVDLRVQFIRKWKTKTVPLSDVRPCP